MEEDTPECAQPGLEMQFFRPLHHRDSRAEPLLNAQGVLWSFKGWVSLLQFLQGAGLGQVGLEFWLKILAPCCLVLTLAILKTVWQLEDLDPEGEAFQICRLAARFREQPRDATHDI